MTVPATLPVGKSFPAPDLRLFASVPRQFIAHAVPDDYCAPLLRCGEVAIVTDQAYLYPESGDWYLVEYSNGTNHRGRERPRRRSIMLIFSRVLQSTGATEWFARDPHPMARGIPNMCDGPYDDFNLLAEKILGRVVGIHAPDRVQTNPTDQEQWEMLRESPWPYPTPMLPPVRQRRAA